MLSKTTVLSSVAATLYALAAAKNVDALLGGLATSAGTVTDYCSSITDETACQFQPEGRCGWSLSPEGGTCACFAPDCGAATFLCQLNSNNQTACESYHWPGTFESCKYNDTAAANEKCGCAHENCESQQPKCNEDNDCNGTGTCTCQNGYCAETENPCENLKPDKCEGATMKGFKCCLGSSTGGEPPCGMCESHQCFQKILF